MKAEVIAFGDELTSGSRLDTNSQWISQQLELLGIPVLFHTTVGDEMAAATDVLAKAMDRVQVIVTTGGLGPTADDLTREALARATAQPLIRNEEALEHIRTLFARRRRTMPDRNAVQADFPRDSQIIPNGHGTAPGIQMEVSRADRPPVHVFALPGVPAEMREMWANSVAPTLIGTLGNRRRHIQQRLIHCFGAGESAVESMLPDLIRRGRQPRVGITASQATISLRVTAEASTPPECQRMLDQADATIREHLGDLVFGQDGEELPDVVVKQLALRRASLAVAECGTGGVVASWLAKTTSSVPSFGGALIIGPREAERRRWTGNAWSDPEFDARLTGDLVQLAQAVRQQFQCELGLAVGPFPPSENPSPPAGRASSPNPTGSDRRGSQEKNVRFVLAGPAFTVEKVVPFGGHPAILAARFAKEALNFVRLELANRPATGDLT
jgi:nicotinamide-nucleotide amidase